MLVQQVLTFINNLDGMKEALTADDNAFHNQLIERFNLRNHEENLSSDDAVFLIDCYKKRWKNIVDGENDYTRNPSEINKKWVEFSKELAVLTGINYLKILIPTLTNTNDLNDNSLLTETTLIENLFLGECGTTLYRKHSFCAHLIKENYRLSIRSEKNDPALRAVTIDELTRLKMCRHTNDAFMVGSERFSNFWLFLQTKVFIGLQEPGEIPEVLFPKLLELIEFYYVLKSSNSDFRLFKNKFKQFCDSLYANKLADINCLYGVQLEEEATENNKYLLDVFITINKAAGFDLDKEMALLSKNLYLYDRNLKLHRKELSSVYQGIITNSASMAKEINKVNNYEFCCKLMVSLFVKKFEVSSFTSRTISLWDISTTVFSNGAALHSALIPLLGKEQSWKTVSEIYSDAVQAINHARSYKACFFSFRFHSTDLFLKNASEHKLGRIYWFAPELLMHNLLSFRSGDAMLVSGINTLLDEIIHTYAQGENDFMKQFRVAILFTKFANGLSDTDRQNVLNVIKPSYTHVATLKFLTNCIQHINNRLFSSGSTVSRFSLTASQLEQICARKDASNVYNLLVECQKQIKSWQLNKEASNKITDYFFTLKSTILSVEQIQARRISYDGSDSHSFGSW